jgi:hypothetical protein
MSEETRRENERDAVPIQRKGLAVEGPGFFVWDEIASDARRRAAELLSIARGASERSP